MTDRDTEAGQGQAGTDHARGCQGREYTCTCGYDDQVEARLSMLERFHAAWVAYEVATATGVGDFIKGRREDLIRIHHEIRTDGGSRPC